MGVGGRRRQLDGLRFLAILPVLVDHIWMPGALPWIFSGTRVGVVGVRLFFVLSGFLITTILVRGTTLPTSGVKRTFLRNFYVRRLLRIAPAYAVCVAAVVVADRAQYGAVWPWVAGFATNVYVLLHEQWPGSLGPLWSLAVQEQFYLVWPWVILFLPRRLRLAALGVLLVAAPAFRFWATYHWDMVQGVMPDYVQTSPLAVCDSLAMGAVVALVVKAGGLGRPVVRRGSAVAGALFVLTIGLSHYGLGARVDFALSDTTCAVLLGLLVYAASAGIGGPVGALLQTRPLVYLGRISFGIYLFHEPVAGAFSTAARHFHVPYGQPGPVLFFVAAPATIAVAAGSWHLLEGRINNLKRFFPYVKPTGEAKRPEKPRTFGGALEPALERAA